MVDLVGQASATVSAQGVLTTILSSCAASPIWYWHWSGNDAALAGFSGDNPVFDALVLPEASACGTKTDTQPVDEPGLTPCFAGMPSFFDDWYQRIHITPNRIDLGNLIGATSRPVEVWNAYLSPVLLRSVTGGEQGLSLSEPVTPPVGWGALEWHLYDANVSALGPSRINGVFLFDWDVGLYDLIITGQRIVPWPWLPNWRDGVLERLEWLTDISEAWDGNEQRARLRTLPRQTWEVTITAARDERRFVQQALWGWQGRAYAIPLWPDGTRLTAAATADDLLLTVADTADRGWASGGLAILVSDGGGSAEVVYLSAVASATRLDLSSGVLGEWPIGTRVYPARIARVQSEQPRAVRAPEVTEWPMRFEVIDRSDGWVALDSVTLYRGEPVLTELHNWREAMESATERQIIVWDTSTTTPEFTDRTGRPDDRVSAIYTRRKRDMIAAFKRFIYARAGRLAGIWVPSFEDDLVLTADAASGDNALLVGNTDLARYGVAVGRRDLEIVRSDGEITRVRLLSAAAVDAETERVTIDGTVGLSLAAGQIRRISWLRWCRMATDAVELLHYTPEVMETTLAFLGVDDDVG